MSEVINLHGVLSSITKPSQLAPDFYFYKQDNFLIVGQGLPNASIFESNESEYHHELERDRYSLEKVYTFNLKTYDLIGLMIDVPVSDFKACKGIVRNLADKNKDKTVYFKNALQVDVFGNEIVMGNWMLKKTVKIREYVEKIGFVQHVQPSEFVKQMPQYQDDSKKDFVLYYPNNAQDITNQLVSLQKWVEHKGLLKQGEFEYLKLYKAYLDDLMLKNKVYCNASYKNKLAAIDMFQKSALGK